MSRIISALIFLFIFSSCKTQYAYFQESSFPNPTARVVKKELPKLKPIQSQQVKAVKVTKSFPAEPIRYEKIFIPIVIPPERELFEENIPNGTFEHPEEHFFRPSVKQDPKAKKKKKNGRKFRKVSSNLFVGFTFLGIAILLAILKIPTLVVLFGIASIIFLAIGLKKIWKKKRRRSRFENLFKRKK